MIAAVVAFASAVVPALRAAPIPAPMVLTVPTGGGIPGRSALDVARLRTVDIDIAARVPVSPLAFATRAAIGGAIVAKPAPLRSRSTPQSPAPCRLALQDVVQWRRTFEAASTRGKETA